MCALVSVSLLSSMQARLTIGIFTVFPGYGLVPPGGQLVITVESSGDQIGRHEEVLNIDVIDRDPKDNPTGIPYWMIIECCAPSMFKQTKAQSQITNKSSIYEIKWRWSFKLVRRDVD